jgi:hypothetical protein
MVATVEAMWENREAPDPPGSHAPTLLEIATGLNTVTFPADNRRSAYMYCCNEVSIYVILCQ